MGKPLLNPNVATLHVYMPAQMNAYLSELAVRPGVTQTRTKTELTTRIMVAFLSVQPWKEPGWEWKRPSAHYVKVDGVRKPNPDWVLLHVRLQDIDVGSEHIKSDSIVAALEKVARDEVPKRSSIDTGMSSLQYSALTWGTTVMFDPKKFASKPIVSPLDAVPPPKLESARRRRTH
ncbi:hypothetical protein [Roseateles sp. MS654]|uniref:hypothetical protein n=1 Tax=Roseateles sp. MS654 TaxID=3412685 RepID=UPI003C2DDD62